MRVNLLFVLLGGLAGLIFGFGLANNSHRNRTVSIVASAEQISIPASATAAPTVQTGTTEINSLAKSSEENLSETELSQIVSQADQDPGNQLLQRNLGLALYRYAVINQQTDLLQTAIRLMKRFIGQGAQTDVEMLATLADALVTEARQTSNPDELNEARQLYLKAIRLKPDDATLRVGLSYTYYLAQPPDLKNTLKNLETALSINSKSEAVLETLIKVLIESGQIENALYYLNELQKINPRNQSIPDIKIRVAQQAIS